MKRWLKGSWLRTSCVVAALALAVPACKDDVVEYEGGNGENGEGNVDESIRLEGLTGPVDITLDEDAVPHIRCKTASDCAAGLGYMHARERFIQMEVRRDFVRGKLHTFVSPLLEGIVGDIDVANRTTYLTRDARPAEEVAIEAASPATIAMLEAYSTGVNAFLERAKEDTELFSGAFRYEHPAFGQIANIDAINEWTPEDSIASVIALVDGLTNSSASELRLGAREAAFDADVFNDLIMPRPISTATTLFDAYPGGITPPNGRVIPKPQPAPRADKRDISAYRGALERALEASDLRDAVLGRHGERGSNNWAVGAGNSASGNALLANDPHLAHTNPATWYAVEMEAEDGSMHVAGVSFAGLPWVILGQNNDIAWGATTTYFDQADVFLEDVNEAGTHVTYDGADVELLTYDIVIGDTTHTAKVVPHHGPIIGESDGKAVSLKWTGQELSTDVNFLTELMTATSVQEGRQAAEMITTLGQNWVMIDTQGNFGWFPYNRLPIRTGQNADMNPAMPLPGDGSIKWEGTIPLEELPQLYNNDEGYLATANNDMTGQLWDGDPTNDAGIPVFQTGVADGLRQERILNELSATDEHTPETMLTLIGDTYMLMRDYVVPHILTILEDEVEGESDYEETFERIEDLAAWDGTCPTGLASSDPEGAASTDGDARAAAKQCLIFHRLIEDLRFEIFDDEMDAATSLSPIPRAQWSALVDLLEFTATGTPNRLQRTDYWDDVRTDGDVETPAEIIRDAVNVTIDWLTDTFGDDEEDWLWGRTHHLTLMADLFPEFGIEDFNNGKYAGEGGFSTVNVANPSQAVDQGFSFGHGASMRWICEGKPEGMRCNLQIPGGQSAKRSSPYYANFLERWLTNTPWDMPFGDEIANPIEEFTIKVAN